VKDHEALNVPEKTATHDEKLDRENAIRRKMGRNFQRCHARTSTLIANAKMPRSTRRLMSAAFEYSHISMGPTILYPSIRLE
jgi:hypothetical protein